MSAWLRFEIVSIDGGHPRAVGVGVGARICGARAGGAPGALEPGLSESRTILESHGLRCTRQRQRIYEALMSTASHPTAEELFELTRRELPGVSLATIYNNLEALVRHGLARRIAPADGPGPCRFDGDMRAHVHVIAGGRPIDVPADLGTRVLSQLEPGVARELESRLGVSIRGVRIEIIADRAGA